ncbi:hypothetical protein DPMN_059889 [Dreissena polymorpha]|uniref:Uncharacterized protein n=1 Tax=Dreissena polymorpha TaxID=45954 RepID=A0A9D4HHM4_DREPO|nr:hypothetical protein DPMN_059889 [Dreissena polymorpha]
MINAQYSQRGTNTRNCAAEADAGAPGLVMGPCIVEIDRIVIRDVQYTFEVIQCTNEEVNFQGSSANSVGGEGGQDGRTDRRTSTQYPNFFSEKRGDNNLQLRHGQKLSARRPCRVFTRPIAETLGIDPRNNAECFNLAYFRGVNPPHT